MRLFASHRICLRTTVDLCADVCYNMSKIKTKDTRQVCENDFKQADKEQAQPYVPASDDLQRREIKPYKQIEEQKQHARCYYDEDSLHGLVVQRRFI